MTREKHIYTCCVGVEYNMTFMSREGLHCSI